MQCFKSRYLRHRRIRPDLCDTLFDLDGEEEYIIYTETVGTIRAEDKDAEKDFYKFVEEAGW